MHGSSGTGGARCEINVTPLVDIVLVLLIIFMVITPMLKVGYEVATPPEITDVLAPPPDDQIVLRLDQGGRIFINREPVLPADLPQRLDAILRHRESKMVFFAAAGELPFSEVAAFLDLCRSSGAENLGIVFDELSAMPTAAAAVGATTL